MYDTLIVISWFQLGFWIRIGCRMYIYCSCILSQGTPQLRTLQLQVFSPNVYMKLISLCELQVHDVAVGAVPALAVTGILVWLLLFLC